MSKKFSKKTNKKTNKFSSDAKTQSIIQSVVGALTLLLLIAAPSLADEKKSPDLLKTKSKSYAITGTRAFIAAAYGNRPLDNLASAYTLEAGLMITPRIGVSITATGLADSEGSDFADDTWLESELGGQIRIHLQGPFKSSGLFVAPNLAYLLWTGSDSISNETGLRAGMDVGYHVGIQHDRLFAEFGTGVGYYLNRPAIHFSSRSIVWDNNFLFSLFAKIGVAL